MSVKYVSGDIFKASGYNIAVVPVNCVGVMGAGVALACKESQPWVLKPYKELCAAKRIKPGDAIVIRNPEIFESDNPSDVMVMLAATKDHWRDPSKKQWVRKCLDNITGLMLMGRLTYGLDIVDIGLPLLGAGKGGVEPSFVKNEIMLADSRINANKHKSFHKHFHVFTGSGLT